MELLRKFVRLIEVAGQWSKEVDEEKKNTTQGERPTKKETM